MCVRVCARYSADEPKRTKRRKLTASEFEGGRSGCGQQAGGGDKGVGWRQERESTTVRVSHLAWLGWAALPGISDEKASAGEQKGRYYCWRRR